MNYLAHLFLSGKNEGIITGALLEDYIVGNIENEKNKSLPEQIKLGLKLHRIIDTFTDNHLHVKHCKELFYPNFGKYAPIIVDVLFDHYLIKNWFLFSEEDFEAFRPRVYKALLSTSDYQPLELQAMIGSMIQHDWLKNFNEWWGLERAFLNLNIKINKPEIDLRKCQGAFEENYYFFNENFLIYFEELKKQCDIFLKDNNPNGK